MFATLKAVPATAVTAVAAVETTAAPALNKPPIAATIKPDPVATGIICISPLPLIDKKSKETSKLFILIL